MTSARAVDERMTTGWRPLTPSEAETWPKARLGGALLGMTIICGLMTMMFMLLIGYVLFSLVLFGVAPSLLGDIGGMGDTAVVGMIYAIPIGTFVIWSVVFFAMTLARASATPTVACVTFALQFVVQIVAPVAAQAYLFADSGGPMMALAIIPTSIPHWLIGTLTLLGFCGYLTGGVRPNAYFRRRVAAPDETISPPHRAPSHPA